MADTTTMQIRPASDADLVAALALDRQLFGDDAWPESEVKEWWKAGAVSMIVAANKDALLGFADAFTINMQAYLRLIHGTITSDQLTIADADPGGDHWWIGVVAVSPKYQQQNIGQTLWLAIDDALGGKVCADIWTIWLHLNIFHPIQLTCHAHTSHRLMCLAAGRAIDPEWCMVASLADHAVVTRDQIRVIFFCLLAV